MASSDQSVELSGAVRRSPIRVAYLVAEGEHADEILEAVFAESCSRWGGRYSLIVPCQNSVPSPEYFPWLLAYDPDIIYSYVDISGETVRRLHEELCPSSLKLHERFATGEPDPHQFRPDNRLEALSSLSTLLPYARAFPASSPRPALIVDYLPGQPHDRFIDDNFGSANGSFQYWPIPESLADIVRPLTVASEERLRDPNLGYKAEGNVVHDTPALLNFMAENRNTFGVAQLASDATPRLDITEHSHIAFNLVVGSTFDDRLMFWNDRGRMPLYAGRQFTTLIITSDRLEDEQFFKALVEFLKARNGIHNPHGTPWVHLRSASLSREQLAELQARFNAADKWNAYHVDRVDRPRPRVPNERILREPGRLVSGGLFDPQTRWKEFSFQGARGQLPAALPDHLRGAQSSLATTGGCALDIEISRETLFGKSSWYLPRRLRMHGSFKAEGTTGTSRANREGHLVLFVANVSDAPVIVAPTDEQAFSYALQQGHDWAPFKRSKREWYPTGPYKWGRPSDKGRYLMGALRLFGGAEAAAEVLLHTYWKDVFESLGSAIGEVRIEAIKLILRKKFRAGELKTEDDWERLARVVASEAHQVRMPRSSIDFDALKTRHAAYLEGERKILEDRKRADLKEWMAHAEASLGRSVKNLSLMGVIHQGYEWQCRTCYHTNWSAVDALHPSLICEVCGTDFAVPVDRPWNFRLNGFLLEALKEHGLLPLVWGLKRLASEARHSFYFLPPHELFANLPRNESVKPDREVDLVCVVDGLVHLVEAKSSLWRIDLNATVDAARRIRPDVVTLALMRAGSRALTNKLNELKELLEGTGIDARAITSARRDFVDYAFLP